MSSIAVDFVTESTYFSFFFFNDTATTEIYTLSLHDALPIWEIDGQHIEAVVEVVAEPAEGDGFLHRLEGSRRPRPVDRKSTRLNSSHGYISYAVFCLKKKKKQERRTTVMIA